MQNQILSVTNYIQISIWKHQSFNCWKHFDWWWPLALLLPHCSRMHLWCSCVQEAFCNLLSPHSYSLLTSTVATVAILMELSSPNYLGTHRVVLPFRRNFPHPRFLSPYLPQHLLTFNIFLCSSIFSCSSNFEEWQMTACIHCTCLKAIWKLFDDRAALKIDIRS